MELRITRIGWRYLCEARRTVVGDARGVGSGGGRALHSTGLSSREEGGRGLRGGS